MSEIISKDDQTMDVSSKVTKSSGATSINLVKHQYTWTISNFSYSANQLGLPLSSPVFTVGTEKKTHWYLSLSQNHPPLFNDDPLGLHITFLPSAVVEAKASCKFSIINDKNINTHIFSFLNVCEFTERNPTWGWNHFADRSFLQNPSSGCLPNDSLTIFCDLTVVESIVSTAAEGVFEDFILPAPRLVTDLVELFEKPKLTDVTIVTRGKEFPAHKVILAARSPYFLSMLEQEEMMEQHNNRLYLMDVRDEVLNEVLRFIYTGVAFVDKLADNILVAADKFQLARLKRLCEQSLVDNIAVENAADRLVIGELYGAAYLKKHALQFICANATEVMETESYKALHNTHPNLIDQALQTGVTTEIGSKTSVGVTTNCLKRRGKKRKRTGRVRTRKE